jgi:hypothetical protein
MAWHRNGAGAHLAKNRMAKAAKIWRWQQIGMAKTAAGEINGGSGSGGVKMAKAASAAASAQASKRWRRGGMAAAIMR